MVCKGCGAPLEDDVKTCPACGKSQEEELSAAPPVEAAEEATQAEQQNILQEEAPQETSVQEEVWQEMPPEEVSNQKKRKGALAIILCIALAAVIVSALVSFGVIPTKEGSALDKLFSLEFLKREEPIEHLALTYSAAVPEEEAVVISGDLKLGNDLLMVYYWQQYYYFLSQYGNYLDGMLDPTKSLAEQYYDETHTWHDMFLDTAFQSFEENAAIYQQAIADGFVMTEESAEYLAGMSDTINDTAVEYGFEGAAEYITYFYGDTVTEDTYLVFAEMSLFSGDYRTHISDVAYTEEEVIAYYDEHAEDYAAAGVEKNDVKPVDVRHILIKPEETKDEAAWTAAEQKAQAILDEWLSGEHSEDSFAALAKENSEDGGSASEGGLYKEVAPGQMTQAFNDWCFEPARKNGDYGMVKTEYGYHVMYFSATAEHPSWYLTAASDFAAEKAKTCSTEILASYAEKTQEMADRVVMSNPAALNPEQAPPKTQESETGITEAPETEQTNP